MSNHFQALGRQLIENGYLILPIKPGAKSPSVAGWQNAKLTTDDLTRYPGHGVGILAGQGAHPIVGIDIDISHPEINRAVIEWCQINLGYSAERVGARPRVLLVYRASQAGWTKGNSISFFDATDPDKPSGKSNVQQVEVLSLGQQFVAYHVHPDTGTDYEWTDFFGGIANIHARDLPIITDAQIDALMAEVERLVRATRGLEIRSAGSAPQITLSHGADALMALTPKVGVGIDELRTLLPYIENDGDGQDYDTWVAVGMALHHEYGDTQCSDEALSLWREWGARSAKDNPREYDYKWQSFGRNKSRSPTTLLWLLKLANQGKRDAELHSRRAALDEITAMISLAETKFDLTDTIAPKIKDLMPNDEIVRAEVVSLFRARFRALSDGVMLPLPIVRSLVAPTKRQDAAPTVLEKNPLTEFGNARRMCIAHKGEMIYVPEIASWYLWRGNHWQKAAEVEIEMRAKATVDSLAKSVETDDMDSEQRAQFYDFCKISQQARMVANMIKLAQSEPDVMVPYRMMDADHNLLGVKNGVVDLRTGLFRPGLQSDYITMTAGCDYQPNAKCHLFDRTLLEVFKGDSETAEFFMACIGYALTGNPTEDMLFIPFGNGSNGKSTILGIIRRVFGMYAKSADASTFVSDGAAGGAGGAREDLVRLRGARFVYVNEPDEGGELREGIVKSMTGGDAITARALYSKESVEIVPTWAVFMPTNHKPIIKGSDNGIWRRLTLIPFERNFENDPTVAKDPKREEKLLAEMPGILNRCIEAAVKYQRNGLVLTQSIRAARDSYKSQMDLLSEWLDSECELDSGHECDASQLWISWEQFAKPRGLLTYIKSSPALGRRLDARFPAKKGSGGKRVRVGLRLKEPFRVLS